MSAVAWEIWIFMATPDDSIIPENSIVDIVIIMIDDGIVIINDTKIIIAMFDDILPAISTVSPKTL